MAKKRVVEKKRRGVEILAGGSRKSKDASKAKIGEGADAAKASGPTTGPTAPLFDKSPRVKSNTYRADGLVVVEFSEAIPAWELDRANARFAMRLVAANAAELPTGGEDENNPELPCKIVRKLGLVRCVFEEKLLKLELTRAQATYLVDRVRTEAKRLKLVGAD